MLVGTSAQLPRIYEGRTESNEHSKITNNFAEVS